MKIFPWDPELKEGLMPELAGKKVLYFKSVNIKCFKLSFDNSLKPFELSEWLTLKYKIKADKPQRSKIEEQKYKEALMNSLRNREAPYVVYDVIRVVVNLSL